MSVLVNGVNYSWANVKLILFGVPVVGITKISYNRKQVKDNNYGWGAEPVSRGYGRIEYEASIELYRDEWVRILSAAGGDVLNIGMFSIQVIYGDIPGTTNPTVIPHQDTLLNCEFLEDPLETNEGDTKILCKIPLIIAGIEHNF